MFAKKFSNIFFPFTMKIKMKISSYDKIKDFEYFNSVFSQTAIIFFHKKKIKIFIAMKILIEKESAGLKNHLKNLCEKTLFYFFIVYLFAHGDEVLIARVNAAI